MSNLAAIKMLLSRAREKLRASVAHVPTAAKVDDGPKDLSPSAASWPFPLLRLPVDLILPIAVYLTEGDTVSLSLSCKALKTSLRSPPVKSITWDEKEKVIGYLEKDLGGGHTFCPWCRVFHAVNESAAASGCQGLHPHECKADSFLPMLDWTNGSAILSYQTFRHLMNCVRYGPSYSNASNNWFLRQEIRPAGGHIRRRGAIKTAATAPEPPPEWRVSFEFKAVGGIVLLKSLHRIRGSQQQLLGDNSVSSHFLCMHTGAWQALTGLSTACWTSSSRGSCLSFSKEYQGCRMCHTTWNVQATRPFGARKISLAIEAVHVLGDATNRLDTEWLLLASPLALPFPDESNHITEHEAQARICMFNLWRLGEKIDQPKALSIETLYEVARFRALREKYHVYRKQHFGENSFRPDVRAFYDEGAQY